MARNAKAILHKKELLAMKPESGINEQYGTG